MMADSKNCSREQTFHLNALPAMKEKEKPALELMHEFKMFLRGSKFQYIPLDPRSESRYIDLDN